MRCFVAILLAAPAAFAQTPDGAALFRKHCAACHRPGSETRAPLPEVLSQMPRQKIADSLEKGTMKAQAAMLSAAERTAVVNFLAKATVAPEAAGGGKCAGPAPRLANIAGWNGWGVDLENTRFQAA